MNLASAYPDSALSAGAMTVLVFVMVISLALWLILVFRADKSSTKDTQQAKSRLDVAAPADTAEDGHSGAGHASADRRHGAAA
jgi:ABC-type nickel/cobalt efflux system permease component RcnA